MPHKARHDNGLTALARELRARGADALLQEIQIFGGRKSLELHDATNPDRGKLHRYTLSMLEQDPSFHTKRLVCPRFENGAFPGSTVQTGDGVIALDPATPTGELVGEAFYVRRAGEHGTASVELSVDPRFRGQGLGTALLKALMQRARVDRIRHFVATACAVDPLVMGWASRHELTGEDIADGVRRYVLEL